MSTGYMSGEAYELPEAREPLMEPTLASVEEISGSLRSEDLFTLTHSQVLLMDLNSWLVNTDFWGLPSLLEATYTVLSMTSLRNVFLDALASLEFKLSVSQ